VHGPSYDRSETVPHLALQDFDIDKELKKYSDGLKEPEHSEKNFVEYLIKMNLITNRVPVTFEYYHTGSDWVGDSLK
jgi:hypothetical protein